MNVRDKHVTKESMSHLTEKIPGAFSVAARSIGMNHQTLKESLESGTLNLVEFMGNFKEQLAKEYEGKFMDEFKPITSHEIADCVEYPLEFIENL